MPRFADFLKKRPWTVWAALLIIGATFFSLTAYNSRYRLNPDGISYISIAQQYAGGHFDTAVNYLYPPMLSWLMVPLIKLGLGGQLAFMGVNLGLALLTMATGMYIVWRQTKRNLAATAFFGAASLPFLAFATGAHITPDLLVVCWMALYLLAAIKIEDWLKKPTTRKYLLSGGLLGLIGASGYLIKQFLIPFFVVSLLLWFIARSLSRRSQSKAALSRRSLLELLKVPALALLVMIIVSAPWVAALSAKNHKFTISTAFSYNLIEKFKSKSTSKTINKPALIPPPHPYAYSYTECPQCPTSLGSPKGGKVKVGGLAGIKYYLKERVKAFPYYLMKVSSTWYLIFPVALALGIAYRLKRISYRKNNDVITAGIFLAVYFAGFVPIVSAASRGGNTRYYWPMLLLALLIMAIHLPDLLRWTEKLSKAWMRQTVILAILLIPLMTWSQYPESFGFVVHRAKITPMQKVALNLMADNVIEPGAKLASNNKRATQTLAYYLKAKSYAAIAPDGADNPTFDSPSVQNKLREYKIDYYIHYARPYDPQFKVTRAQGTIIRTVYIHRLVCLNVKGAHTEQCLATIIRLPNS